MEPKKMKKMLSKTTMSILAIMVLLSILNVFSTNALTIYSDAKEKTSEIIEKRGEFEKHFQNDDGTITAVTYADPIHYKNKEGKWIDIDNTLIENDSSLKQDGTYTNKNNSFNVTLNERANADNLVSINIDNYKLSWKFDNIQDVKSVIINDIDKEKKFTQIDLSNLTSEAIYKNAFKNADLRYILSFKSLKEEIILNEVPTLETIKYILTVENLKAEIDKDNNVVFYDIKDNEKKVFKISTPFMYDAADTPNCNTNVKVEIEETKTGYIITNKLDMKWLKDKSRVYPVIIDPVITSNQAQTNIADSYVNSGSPNTNYAMSNKLVLGKNSGSNRALIKINTMPTIPSGAAILDAKLTTNLWSGTSTWGALAVYRLNSSWNSYTVTWNNHSSISKGLLSSGITPTYNSPYYKYSINVTDTVKSWYANGMTNNWGFMLKYQDENYNDYNWLYSSDSGISSTYRPAIVVTYENTDKFAFTVGSKYGGSLAGDSTETAGIARDHLNAMGYTTRFLNQPTYYDMIASINSSRKWIQSDVLFFVGHTLGTGEAQIWNYDGQGGDYQTGIKTGNPGSCNTSEYASYMCLGLGYYSLSNTELAVFQGCYSGSTTNSLADYAISRGVKSAIGWTTTVPELYTLDWTNYFMDRLSVGQTVQQAMDYANSQYYNNYNIKNAVLKGNPDQTINSNSMYLQTNQVPKDEDNTYNLNKSIEISNLKKEDKTNLIASLVKSEVNKEFNVNDYVSSRIETSDNTTYYDFGLKISGVKCSIGYVVRVNEQKNMIVAIYDHMKGYVASELIVNREASIKLRLNNLNERKKEEMKNKAMVKNGISKDFNRTLGNEYTYYDVEEDKLYYIIDAEDRQKDTGEISAIIDYWTEIK